MEDDQSSKSINYGFFVGVGGGWSDEYGTFGVLIMRGKSEVSRVVVVTSLEPDTFRSQGRALHHADSSKYCSKETLTCLNCSSKLHVVWWTGDDDSSSRECLDETEALRLTCAGGGLWKLGELRPKGGGDEFCLRWNGWLCGDGIREPGSDWNEVPGCIMDDVRPDRLGMAEFEPNCCW